MTIFNFYVWENTMDNLRNQILMFGGLAIIVNTLNAISTMLGIIGIYKKIALLVRIRFLPCINPPNITSGLHLGFWPGLLPLLLDFLDHHPLHLCHRILCLR